MTSIGTKILKVPLQMFAKYSDDRRCSAGLPVLRSRAPAEGGRPASFAAHRAALQKNVSLYFATLSKPFLKTEMVVAASHKVI